MQRFSMSRQERTGQGIMKGLRWCQIWALAAGLGAGALMGSAQAAQTLVLGHGAAPGNPRALAAEHMAELVNQYSNGDLELTIQGSEQLGSDLQMLQQVQSGALGLSANSQGALGNIAPKANVFGLPFLFDSPEAAWQVVDGPIGDEVAQQAEQRGFKVLAWWDNGLRQFTNNVRPITTPSDMKGLKMRTPQDAITIDTLRALGANPTPLAFGELYVALKQGTVDGQENPVVNIISSHLEEVQKYLSMSDYMYQVAPVVIGMPTWQRLSKENQQAILKAADETTDFQRQTLVSQTEELMQKLRSEGQMAINDVDAEAFRKATRSVDATWEEKLGDIVSRAREAAMKANESHQATAG